MTGSDLPEYFSPFIDGDIELKQQIAQQRGDNMKRDKREFCALEVLQMPEIFQLPLVFLYFRTRCIGHYDLPRGFLRVGRNKHVILIIFGVMDDAAVNRDASSGRSLILITYEGYFLTLPFPVRVFAPHRSTKTFCKNFC
jgi:hypothetical protein